SEDTASEDTASEDTASEDTAPEDTASEDTASEDTASEDTASEDTASEDTASEDTTLEIGEDPLLAGTEDAWGPADDEGGGGFEDMSLEELLSVEIVESASRREQSIHNAASAVTLIPRDAIASMGVLDVPELFRRVPGAVVFRTAANSYRLSLRDPATLVSNRAPILIDGRPVGDGISNLTAFQWLPITVDDLERVEVIRGPGSTLYGANAQGGVVSLRTRRPLDAIGFSGRLAGGVGFLPAEGDESSSVRTFGVGNVAYGVANEARTMGARLSFGYGLTPEWTRPEGSEGFRRGEYRYHTRLSLQYAPSEDTELLVIASHADTELSSLTSGDAETSVFRFREEAWGLRARQASIAEVLDLSLAYDTSVLRMDTTGFGDATQWQHNVRLQADLALFDDRSRTTLGLELARLNVTRLTPVEPKVTTYSLVVQEELSILPERFLVNGTVRFDLTRYDDGEGVILKYRNANPRVSLIFRPSSGHDLRLTVATGYRVATPIEVSSGVSRPAPSPDDPPIPFVVPNPRLVPEEVRTIELGYRGDIADALRVEFVPFLQESRSTVFVTAADSLPLFYENTETVNHIGFDVDLRLTPHERVSAYAHYRYMRSRGDETGEKKDVWPVHVGGLGIDGELGLGIRLHADFYFVTRIAQQELGALEGTPIITSGFVRSPNIYDANLTISRSVVDERVRIFATVRNFAAFFRDREDLIQGLSGFSSPVGATFLVGVELEPTGG
ncbi:MAG: TonB-dependent receptor, partial [Myxococcota bacterium]